MRSTEGSQVTRNTNPWLGPLLAITLAQIAVSFLSRVAPTVAPEMAARMHWSVADIGMLSSANAIGWCFFIVAGLPLVLRAGPSTQPSVWPGRGRRGYPAVYRTQRQLRHRGKPADMVRVGSANGSRKRRIARHAPPGSQNLVFSIKQAGVPLGGVLAGLMLPALADSVGLIATFGVCAVLTLATLVAIQPQQQALDAMRDRAQAIHLRVLLSVANLKRPLAFLIADKNLQRIFGGGRMPGGRPVVVVHVSHLPTWS